MQTVFFKEEFFGSNFIRGARIQPPSSWKHDFSTHQRWKLVFSGNNFSGLILYRAWILAKLVWKHYFVVAHERKLMFFEKSIFMHPRPKNSVFRIMEVGLVLLIWNYFRKTLLWRTQFSSVVGRKVGFPGHWGSKSRSLHQISYCWPVFRKLDFYRFLTWQSGWGLNWPSLLIPKDRLPGVR